MSIHYARVGRRGADEPAGSDYNQPNDRSPAAYPVASLDHHPEEYFREDRSGDNAGALEHEVGRSRDEVEAHVLQDRWAGIWEGWDQEIIKFMRGFAWLEGQLVFFAIGEIQYEAEAFSNEHGEWLHVGMEKLAMIAALVHVLASHKFVSYLACHLPKVEMVPHIKKIVTAITFAPRSVSIATQ